MKRNNYYAIHKNKKPKNKLAKKTNPLAAKLAILQMKSFIQHSIIVSQNFNSIAEKTIAVVENTKKHAEAISDLFSKINRERYLKQKAFN